MPRMSKKQYMVATGREWWQNFTIVDTLSKARTIQKVFGRKNVKIYEIIPVKDEDPKPKRRK